MYFILRIIGLLLGVVAFAWDACSFLFVPFSIFI